MEGCMELGGPIIGGWSESEIIELKNIWGHTLGMAFQITDDIMDYRGETTETTGKASRK